MILGMSSSLVLILGYFLKFDITAAAMVIAALMCNILFLIEEKSSHHFLSKRATALFMLPVIAAAWVVNTNFATFQTYQLLILICPLIITVGFTFQNIKWLKVCTIINGAGWLTYELATGAYGVMIGELAGIIMATIALQRISSINQKEENLVQETKQF